MDEELQKFMAEIIAKVDALHTKSEDKEELKLLIKDTFEKINPKYGQRRTTFGS